MDRLVYAGGHGFDIAGPGGLRLEYEPGKQRLPELDSAERELRRGAKPVDGAEVERKRFSIAVHYRNVSDEDAESRDLTWRAATTAR